MDIKLVVPAKIIATLKLFAGRKDIRWYINSINIEVDAEKMILVATNGEILGCFRIANARSDIDKPLTNIIIPIHAFAHVKGIGDVEIIIDALKSGSVTVKFKTSSVTTKILDATYPNFRRIIPRYISEQPAQFNMRLLGVLAKAWAVLHSTKATPRVVIGYNGSDFALVSLGYEDFIGVIAPLHCTPKPILNAPPDWVNAL